MLLCPSILQLLRRSINIPLLSSLGFFFAGSASSIDLSAAFPPSPCLPCASRPVHTININSQTHRSFISA